MSQIKKSLSSKQLLIVGIVSYAIAFLLGGIIGDALKTLGFIILAMALLALNRELKQKKKDKELSSSNEQK